MSKWFGFLVIAASFAALVVNVSLLVRMTKAEQAIRKVQHLKIEVSPELQKKIEQRLNTSITDIKTEMKSKTDEISNKFRADLDKVSKQQEKINSQLAGAMNNNITHSQNLSGALKRETELFTGQMANSRKQYDASVKNCLNEYKKKNTAMLSGMQGMADKHRSDLTKHFDNLKKETKDQTAAAFRELKEENKREIQKFAKGIDALARQKIAGNEVAAEDAFKKALEFEKKGDLQSAQLYCLNAINHAPNKKQYFDVLYRITESNKKSGITELEQLRSVLELGLYQVDGKDIPAMSKMLASIIAKQEKISEAAAKRQSIAEQKQIEAELTSLKNGDFSWDAMFAHSPAEAIPVLRNRLSKLTNLIERTTGDATEFCKKEVSKTNALLEYSVAMISIDNALKKTENLLKSGQATPAANSMVQSANNILSQAWNIDFTHLPQELRKKLHAQADRIAGIEKQFNKIKSRPALAKIKSIYENVDLNGNCTQKINTLQNAIKQIMAEATKVYEADERNGIEAKIEDLSNQVKEYTKERYKGYQDWAVKVCDKVFEKYKNKKLVFDDEAVSFIRDLKEIDPALLTPSVSRLYQDVLSKQFAELGWKKIATMESELATSTKMTIEDCPNE